MKLYLKCWSIGIFISCFITAAGIQSVHATATLRLDGGSGYFDIADGSESDISPASNVITYSGSVGNFSVLVATGVQTGTTSYPVLGFNTFEVTSSSGGTLTAWFSNNDFEPTSSPAEFDMHGSGSKIVGSGTVNFSSYIDNSNELFGETTPLGSLGPYTSASFSGDINGSIASLSDPYSFTSKATIDLSSNTVMQTTMNVSIVAGPGNIIIPEPVSSTLFIIGGATLGFRHFRKNRAV